MCWWQGAWKMAAAGWLSRVRNKCQIADEGLRPQGSHVEVWTHNIENVTFLTIYENLPYIKVDHYNHETRVWHIFKFRLLESAFKMKGTSEIGQYKLLKEQGGKQRGIKGLFWSHGVDKADPGLEPRSQGSQPRIFTSSALFLLTNSIE